MFFFFFFCFQINKLLSAELFTFFKVEIRVKLVRNGFIPPFLSDTRDWFFLLQYSQGKFLSHFETN